jgi:Asp-tRNA(Asn)/Glu-tRNA(Gln) amidotransferase A subunit family amidase
MMRKAVVVLLTCSLLSSCSIIRPGAPAPAPVEPFNVVEASIADIHAAMRAGRISARSLVELYLARIEAYDRQGPALNSLILVNPRVLEVADSLDALFRNTGQLAGPLHGIPVIVKDNFDTVDMPTTAGSASLAGSRPAADAFQVRKVREAGAIVFAKSNMAEFAFTPYETVGSMLPGYTRNPYAPERVTAGSSGGTAAAVAASLGTVGLGTDTGNSIRGPASHTALVGIRSTMGLTSRAGIIPLYIDRDIGGPMARTVTDAVVLFDVIAGHDPADSITTLARGRRSSNYNEFLVADGLRGTRIGVVRQLAEAQGADAEVILRFNEALDALRAGGAITIDPAHVPELDSLPTLFCTRFKTDINAYLAKMGPRAPVKNLDEIIASKKYHPSIEQRLLQFQQFTSPAQDARCKEAVTNAKKLEASLRTLMWERRLDALVYPTWSNPPRLIGDLSSPHGNNSFQLSPPTGFPAITVPMGYVAGGLPVGLQFLGDAWSEWKLIALAYSYEQATKHRRPPPTTPALGEQTSSSPPKTPN